MRPYQREFIDLARRHKALTFGHFTLKSARRSPYFFNAGAFASGAALAALGRHYARRIVDAGIEFDGLLGPAYKGIPLVSTTAVALADHHARDLPFTYNRKETKDHGEGGALVGAPLQGRLLIVDDVITAGTAVGEMAQMIRGAGAELAGVVVGLDRQERGRGELSAIQEFERRWEAAVHSLVTLDDLIAYLESGDADGDVYEAGIPSDALEQMRAYRKRYGV